MTILNIAVGAHEVAIVTDSRQSAAGADGSDVALPHLAQKCVAFPALNLLVAHSGGAGAGAIARELESYLQCGVLAGNILELADRAPQTLADLARSHKFAGFGRVVLAGIANDRAHAFVLDAPNWTAQPLPQGAWVQPTLRMEAVEPANAPVDRPPTADLTPPIVAPTFRDSLRTITLLPDRQHEQNPVTCGGPLILSQIDTGGVIRQQVLRALG